MFTAESLKEANGRLATVSIKGKDYVQVTERVRAFRMICPEGRIETAIISLENGVVTMKTEIYDDGGKLIATGFAQEKEENGHINRTSFIENCETSSVGRALGFAGIGIDASMASAEEVANAIINQNRTEDDTRKSAVHPETNGNENRPTEQAYPTREEMMRRALKSYPPESLNYRALVAALGVPSLADASDKQLMKVYDKCMGKATA